MKPGNARPLLAMALAICCCASTASAQADDLFRECDLHLELDDLHDDARLVLRVSSFEGLRHVTLMAPTSTSEELTLIVEFHSKDALGQRELLIESAAPSLDELHDAFPEGNYRVLAETVEGRTLKADVPLAHALLAAPELDLADEDEVSVDAGVHWSDDPDAIGYVLELVSQDLDLGLTARLPVGATTLPFPAGLLRPGTRYQLAVGVVGGNGNIVITRVGFSTEP